MLAESARIAGDRVFPIHSLNTKNFDCLFIPGGVGATRSLSDWGNNGADMTVSKEITNVITQFHKAGKYIGVGQQSSLLVANVLGDQKGGPGITLSMGFKGETFGQE